MRRLLQRVKIRKQEKEAFRKELIGLKKESLNTYKDFMNLFSDKSKYVSLSDVLKWQEKHEELHTRVSAVLHSEDFKSILRRYKDDLITVPKMYKLIQKYRKKHNKPLLSKLINDVKQEDFTVNRVELNREQKTAIVMNEKKLTLVGAGSSGLTYTCIGKAKYLVKNKGVDENNLLFLTDSKKNADKINEILTKEGVAPLAKSYIDFSSQLLKEHGKDVLEILHVEYEEFTEETVNALLEDDSYKLRFIDYYLNFRQAGSVVFDFNDYEEYLKFLEEFPPVALDGTRMKNYEHLAVADFLYRNNIRYRYMDEYCVSTHAADGSIYRPVFYLPDFDIYIEVFEINAVGEARFDTGTYLVSDSPTEIYKGHMNRVREIHSKNNTTLVDAFTFELMDSTLADHLQKKLLKHGVVFAPMSPGELLDKIFEQNPYIVREVSVVLAELIQLARDFAHTPEDIIFLNREISRTKARGYKRNESIITLLVPVYEKYIQHLEGKTDFFGVVNMASETLRLQRKPLRYTHIIVDNFENTNRQMINLLINVWNIVKDQGNIFVAGNDWQTKSGMYAYDFSYLTEFSRFFGHSELVQLTKVFSQGQSLWSMNARFIEKNTLQRRKYARSEFASPRDCVTLLSYEYRRNDGDKSLFDEEEIEIMKKTLQNYINLLPDEYSVILVGRFKEDIILASKMNLSDIPVKTVYELDERADVIILINSRRYNMGFPDRIMGESVKELFGIKTEMYPFASERRLWHQAISKARIKVAFLYNSENKSRFTEEFY